MDNVINLISDSDDDETAEKSTDIKANTIDDASARVALSEDDKDIESDGSFDWNPIDPRLPLKDRLLLRTKKEELRKKKDVSAHIICIVHTTI